VHPISAKNIRNAKGKNALVAVIRRASKKGKNYIPVVHAEITNSDREIFTELG